MGFSLTFTTSVKRTMMAIAWVSMTLATSTSWAQQEIESQEELSGFLVGKFDASQGNVYYSLETALKEAAEVKQLDLSDKGLTEVPSEIAQLTNLQVLDLSDNKLNSVPSFVSQLIGLQEIDLSQNELKEIPSALCALVELRSLKLGNNQIKSLAGFACLKSEKLEKLALQKNEITSVSSSDLSNLKTVKTLMLQGNDFTVFPDEICNFDDLNLLVLPNDVLFRTPSCLKYWQDIYPTYQVWSREHAYNYMLYNSSPGFGMSSRYAEDNSSDESEGAGSAPSNQSHTMRATGNAHYTARVNYPTGFMPVKIGLSTLTIGLPVNALKMLISKKFRNRVYYTMLSKIDRKIDREAARKKPNQFKLKRLEEKKRIWMKRIR